MTLIYGYARVSTDGQTLDAQRETLKAAGAGHVFEETVSGARADRRRLAMALKQLGPGDMLLVTRLDRLARSARDLLNILAIIGERGATFRSLADSWADTSTPHGRLMVTVLGGLAEFERELIRVRTGEGRERAKARGVKMGRKPKLTSHQRMEALMRRDGGVESLSDIGRSYNVSHSTISRLRLNASPVPGDSEPPRGKTALEGVAAHGSVSYGHLPAERLKAIMLGDVPSEAESARVHQGLTETVTYKLLEMGRDIGLNYEGLQLRYEQLTGQSLPPE